LAYVEVFVVPILQVATPLLEDINMRRDIDVLAYDYEEAALALGVSRSLIIKAVQAGLLPSKKLGRRILISRQALERFLS
jgi:excisionase family DNA binding protein